MSNLRLRTVGQYFAVPMTALTVAAIGMACAPVASAAGTAPAPAASRAVSAPAGASQPSASSAQGAICLTNASSNCVSIQPGSAFNAVLGSNLIDRNIVGTDQAGH